MTTANIYERHLDKSRANYTPLSPLSFIERTALIYPDYPSVVYGVRRYTWAETYSRCRQLAGALSARGLGVGDTVDDATVVEIMKHFAMIEYYGESFYVTKKGTIRPEEFSEEEVLFFD